SGRSRRSRRSLPSTRQVTSKARKQNESLRLRKPPPALLSGGRSRERKPPRLELQVGRCSGGGRSVEEHDECLGNQQRGSQRVTAFATILMITLRSFIWA